MSGCLARQLDADGNNMRPWAVQLRLQYGPLYAKEGDSQGGPGDQGFDKEPW
jgi:hypothetical protein